jgi:hypothetical protein
LLESKELLGSQENAELIENIKLLKEFGNLEVVRF